VELLGVSADVRGETLKLGQFAQLSDIIYGMIHGQAGA